MSESCRRDRPFLVWGGVVRAGFMEEGSLALDLISEASLRAHGQHAWGEVLRPFEELGCPSLKWGASRPKEGHPSFSKLQQKAPQTAAAGPDTEAGR